MDSPIDAAVRLVGIPTLAAATGRSRATIYKWQRVGRLPYSEILGTTRYAQQIEEITEGKVTAAELLSAVQATLPSRS